MKNIINFIKNDTTTLIGNKTDSNELLLRLTLLNASQIAYPNLEYIQFIKEINGLKNYDTTIYGCYEETDKIFIDILDKNILLDRTDKSCILVLGENIMDYLVYNKQYKKYETRDRDTDEITFTFDTLKDALSYFLDINEE